MEKAYLGLDVGTSALKAALISSNSKIIQVYTSEVSPECADGRLIDPERLLQNVKRFLSEICANHSQMEIETVCLSTMFPSFVPVNAQGLALMKIHTWQSLSGEEFIIEALYKKLPFDLYKKTGCPAHHSYSLWKILWLQRHHPEIFEKTFKFVSISEFLTIHLTGEFVISSSIASTTGMFNIKYLHWDEEIFAYFKLNKCQVNPICPPTTRLAIDKKGVTEIPIKFLCPGVGDGLAAHIGSGCQRLKALSSTMGTSAALRLSTSSPVLADQHVWCHYLRPNEWIYGCAINAGGGTLSWFLEKYFPGETIQLLSVLENNAKRLPISGPIFFPFTNGERGPDYLPLKRQWFLDLTPDNSRQVIFRSVVEGIFFNFYSCYRKLISVAEVPEMIIASGGYTRSPFMLQMQADMFGKIINISTCPEPSACGAVLLALDINSNQDERYGCEKAFYPDMNKHELYLERFNIYSSYCAKTIDENQTY